MGTVFTYVADHALSPVEYADWQCHCCARSGLPIFDYMGTIISPERAADPALAREHPDVDALCADCINSDAVEHWSDSSIASLIARFSTDPQVTWKEFHKLPDMPGFAQRFDWPICCGIWCEFIGHPESLAVLIALQRTQQYWKNGPADGARDFSNEGEPESLCEISSFRCVSCENKYYVDQFT